ncbi:MAG: family 16 glycoside hydrolase [Niastella sp.]|uniref:family 16 glycoside hydrolase n=1 Tax=Niastella sp. TaxID=1869183 RepID=UPI00389AD1A3
MVKNLFRSTVLLLSSLPFLNTQGQGINLADWRVLSEQNNTAPLTDTIYQDKACVKLDGKALAGIWNKTIALKNFRLELDIAGTVMPGIGFHAKDEQNYQFLYFRPGYGGTIEAIQYIPIYNGALSWVFYGGYQAAANIHKNEWFHASIEVRGNHLKVFTNNNPKPDMDITMMQTEADKGALLLRTMFGPAYFANLNWRELPEGITDWEISDQLPAGFIYDYEKVKKLQNWKKINEPADDYVNLCRYFKLPEGTVVARHILYADSVTNKLLDFDFTGTLRIILNGKEIFSYDKHKLERVEADTYTTRLSLQKGQNELLFITQGDGFIFGKGYNSLGRLQHQNWGFIAGIENPRK